MRIVAALLIAAISLLLSSCLRDPRDARDLVTESLAYRTAADHFFRAKVTAYHTPNIAAYSPDSVTAQPNHEYAVSLVYEGIGFDGKPAPNTALYKIKCTSGLCMVMEGPL